MGWNITLTSDREIGIEEMDGIVHHLTMPENGPLWFKFQSRQMWGWSTAIDIYLPKENTIELHGSFGITGPLVPFLSAHTIARALEHRGHKIEIGEMT